MSTTTAGRTDRGEWEDRRAEVAADQEPGWEARYRPGSFGCHELLDRLDLIGDLVEGRILEHPACVLNKEWFGLAAAAVEALRELYQRVGGEHLTAGRTEPG
ncbi:MAG: hypothetical protein K2X82_02250 [Gemmataceae bacterium]|nr:hypothetical protein [Gemmataceae bacterium]